MPILLLSPQLANQIAAGEVIERPASIVKELIENSLDAGATHIEIYIEKGGIKRILLRDNGCGIPQHELILALTRHATSKIKTLDDLESITTLGFRGEALASISSVARLTLTSSTAKQQQAWQAYAEGRNMNVSLKPAAHPTGTTVDVLDLFFNTPARRKFLRSDKTEFMHIDECIRRIALSHCHIHFMLYHNQKLVRQYKPVQNQDTVQIKQRFATLCGTEFAQKMYPIAWQHDDLTLTGWILPTEPTTETFHYFYVNNRMVKDRIVAHAIKQAYQTFYSKEIQPSYVIYLVLDPYQVDVNVHPAKHEVRFHQSRLVHDFIYQAILAALHNYHTKMDVHPVAAPSLTTFDQPQYKHIEMTKPVVQQKEKTNNLTKDALPYSLISAQKNSTQLKEQQLLYQKLVTPTETTNTAQQNTLKSSLFPEKHVMKQQMESLFLQASSQTFGRVLAVTQNSYAVVEYKLNLHLLSIDYANYLLLTKQLSLQSEKSSEGLLSPLTFTATQKEKTAYQQYNALLKKLNIHVELVSGKIILYAVPSVLRKIIWQQFLPQLLVFLAQDNINEIQFIEHISHNACQLSTQWSQAQAIQIIADLERTFPEYVISPPPQLLQPIDIQSVIRAFPHE